VFLGLAVERISPLPIHELGFGGAAL